MKEAKAIKITIEIFRVILEEFNGYAPEKIIKEKLAEECESSVPFQKIKEILTNPHQ